jgi:DNA-binding NarL/FixJ family response regulator
MITVNQSFSLKKKILLIQDDSKATDILVYLIGKSERFQIVATCDNYGASLKMIKQTKPHIIISDIFSSGENILSFISKFKDLSHESKLLILSDVDAERTIFDIFKFGADGFIFRPEGLHSIVDELDKIITGHNSLSPRIINKIVSALKINRNSPLSARESEVMKLLTEGMTYNTIASRLNISSETSRTHIKNIYKKLNVRSRSEAVKTALGERLV